MSAKVVRFLMGFGSEAATIAAIQAINFLVPLAALPLLSRVLGLATFGVYATVLVLSLYSAAVSDYTFNTNGPLRLSREVSNPVAERTLLAASFAIRLGLATLCMPIVALVLLLSAHAGVEVVMAACLSIAANAATPRWAMYAQGRLRSFLVFTGLSRGLWYVGTIWLVTKPDDVVALLIWTAVCQLGLAVACWAVVRPSISPPPGHALAAGWRVLREDFGLFLSTMAVSLVRDGAPFALSVLHGPTAMSLYAVSDRVRVAAIGLSAPFTQSLFLRLARDKASGTTDDRLRAAGNLAVLVPVTLGCAALAVVAEPIVEILAGPEYGATTDILRLLLLAPPVLCFNSLIGANTLLAEGERDSYARAQLLAAAISTPLILLLVYTSGLWGAAIATVGQEIVLALTLLWYLNKANLLRRALLLRGTSGHTPR